MGSHRVGHDRQGLAAAAAAAITEKWKSNPPMLLGKGISLSQSLAILDANKLQEDLGNFSLLFCSTLIGCEHSFRHCPIFLIKKTEVTFEAFFLHLKAFLRGP